MEDRTPLYASLGKVLTNGETYGTIIYLADDAENNFYEITLEEYRDILAANEDPRPEDLI